MTSTSASWPTLDPDPQKTTCSCHSKATARFRLLSVRLCFWPRTQRSRTPRSSARSMARERPKDSPRSRRDREPSDRGSSMTVTLTVRDESTSGKIYHEMPLGFPSERITVRDLIRERVYQEVQDFNRSHGERVFRGLVQPTDTERVLNGERAEYRLKAHREIAWKSQFEKAIEAFESNGFFILIDND